MFDESRASERFPCNAKGKTSLEQVSKCGLGLGAGAQVVTVKKNSILYTFTRIIDYKNS